MQKQNTIFQRTYMPSCPLVATDSSKQELSGRTNSAQNNNKNNNEANINYYHLNHNSNHNNNDIGSAFFALACSGPFDAAACFEGAKDDLLQSEENLRVIMENDCAKFTNHLGTLKPRQEGTIAGDVQSTVLFNSARAGVGHQEQQQFCQNQNVCNCNEPHAEEQQQRQGSPDNAHNSKHVQMAQYENKELLKQDVEKLKQDVERLKNDVKEVGTEYCRKDRLVCPPKASADAANHANALDEGLESGQCCGREKEDDYEDEDDVPSVDKKTS